MAGGTAPADQVSITSQDKQKHQPPTTTVIASRKAAHPRVASLAPAGQFTFWQSPGIQWR